MRRLDRAIKDLIIDFIQAVLWVLLGLIGLWGRLTALRWPYPRFEPDNVRKILVLRLDLLGDVLLSMPAVGGPPERDPPRPGSEMILAHTGARPPPHPLRTPLVVALATRIR